MQDNSSEDNPLAELADEFLTRYRRGERPSLTEYARQHPELADEIRELFPTLTMMEDACGGSDVPPTKMPDSVWLFCKRMNL